jgi:adenosylhomocysteine nucleosidase
VSGLLILTAVELEAAGLARELEVPAETSRPSHSSPRASSRRFSSYRTYGRPGLRIAPVGLGAALLAERWAACRAGLHEPLVISAGVCGGLDPHLAPGELVVPGRVLAPDGEILAVPPAVHARVLAAAGPAATGLLVTTRVVVSTPAAKAALRSATGAAAVDMESAAILAAARAAGLEAAAIRAVSDGAAESVPSELAALLGPEGRLRGGRALLLALTRPQTLPRALELRRGSRRALAAVARALAALRD